MRKGRPYFRHFVVEANNNSVDLDSIDWIDDRLNSFLDKLGIQKVKKINHKFSPQGISLVCILNSSHIAVHTWPENNYLHIDLVTCSKNSKLNNIKEISKFMFGEKNTVITELKY